MNLAFQVLVEYTNKRLATAGLTISTHGIAEMQKRWKLPEEQGGFSDYWKGN